MKVGLSFNILSVLLGVLAATGVYTFFYSYAYSYVSNEPEVCINCHVMQEQYDSWIKSSHKQVAVCNDCHTPHGIITKWLSKAENGFWHSKGFTFNDFHEPIQIRDINKKVLQTNCLQCHHGLLAESHENHKWDGESGFSCVRCHRAVGHAGR